MIITCPACQTRYLVDDAALGGNAGRRVRCASCGNVWHVTAEEAAISEAIAKATAAAEAAAVAMPESGVPSQAAPPAPALRAEPGTAAPHHAPGPGASLRPSVAVELPAAARRRQARLGGVAAIALLLLVIVVLLVARDPIVETWPSTAAVYRALHQIEPAGSGLRLTATPTRAAGSIVVDGEIVNSGQVARHVPRLRLTLRDGNRLDLGSQEIDPPVATLAPGATARFNTVFEHPSITATTVDVTFASP